MAQRPSSQSNVENPKNKAKGSEGIGMIKSLTFDSQLTDFSAIFWHFSNIKNNLNWLMSAPSLSKHLFQIIKTVYSTKLWI
jgi:hypothetical protein